MIGKSNSHSPGHIARVALVSTSTLDQCLIQACTDIVNNFIKVAGVDYDAVLQAVKAFAILGKTKADLDKAPKDVGGEPLANAGVCVLLDAATQRLGARIDKVGTAVLVSMLKSELVIDQKKMQELIMRSPPTLASAGKSCLNYMTLSDKIIDMDIQGRPTLIIALPTFASACSLDMEFLAGVVPEATAGLVSFKAKVSDAMSLQVLENTEKLETLQVLVSKYELPHLARSICLYICVVNVFDVYTFLFESIFV
jgi:hypothetical protein